MYGTINAYGNAQLQLGDTYIVAADSIREEYQRFVDSLFFSELHAREESIEQPSDGTLHWIFDGEDAETKPVNPALRSATSRPKSARCDEFTTWLRQGSENMPSFWIRGKAGSGKSTLMSYLCQRICESQPPQDQESILNTVVLKHFFWELGAPLQRSMLGCLRTLLWQFFASYPNHGFCLWKEHLQQRLRLPRAWTLRLLNDTFDLVVKYPVTNFFLFIDGLDECAERGPLLQFLRGKQNNSNIKLCASSRPDRNLELTVGNWPFVKLEELTENDMYEYVRTEVSAAISMSQASTLYAAGYLERLMGLLVTKAEGVFVWLTVACRSLIEGIENRDDTKTLSQRLEELPSDVLQLYNHMLRRNQGNLQRYSESAACIFSLMLENLSFLETRDYPLVWLSWALNDTARVMLLRSDLSYYNVLSIHEQIDHEQTEIWIKTRCTNLVDVSRSSSMYENVERPSALYNLDTSMAKDFDYKFATVSFTHKTVVDFLVTTKEGRDLLKGASISKEEAQNKILEAILCDAICSYTLVHTTHPERWWWQTPTIPLQLDKIKYHQWKLLQRTLERLLPREEVSAWFSDALWFSLAGRWVIPSGRDGFLYIGNSLGYFEHVRETILDSQLLDPIVLTRLLFLTVQSCSGRTFFNHSTGLSLFSFIRHLWPERCRIVEHVRFLLENGAKPDLCFSSTEYKMNRWAPRFPIFVYCCRQFTLSYLNNDEHHYLADIMQLLVKYGADLKTRLPQPLLEVFVQPSNFSRLGPEEVVPVAQTDMLSVMIKHGSRCELEKGCPVHHLRNTLRTLLASLGQRKVALYRCQSNAWYFLSGADMPESTTWALADDYWRPFEHGKGAEELWGADNTDIEEYRWQGTFPELLYYFEWEEDDIQAALFEPNFDEWRALFTERDPAEPWEDIRG